MRIVLKNKKFVSADDLYYKNKLLFFFINEVILKNVKNRFLITKKTQNERSCKNDCGSVRGNYCIV